jgi:hypothetical protein
MPVGNHVLKLELGFYPLNCSEISFFLKIIKTPQMNTL